MFVVNNEHCIGCLYNRLVVINNHRVAQSAVFLPTYADWTFTCWEKISSRVGVLWSVFGKGSRQAVPANNGLVIDVTKFNSGKDKLCI